MTPTYEHDCLRSLYIYYEQIHIAMLLWVGYYS